MQLAGAAWRAQCIASLLWLAGACASPAQRVPPAASDHESISLDLEAADAEVWAWEATVAGTARPPVTLEKCAIDVSGAPQPATVNGARFAARLRLAPGVNAIRASCSTARGELRSAVVRFTVRLIDRPKAFVRARLERGALLLDGTSSRPGEYAGTPIVRWQWALQSGLDDHSGRDIGEGPRLSVPAPIADGEYRYVLRIADGAGQADRAAIAVRVATGVPSVRAISDEPSYLDDAVLYGIVPWLYGGVPLRAATAALDAIADLGVSMVWLPPLFGTLPGDYGYAVTDFEHVRQDYGTPEDLRAFVAVAHRRNMRVLLDFVPNHTSREHPYFQQAAMLRRRSHYFEFFEWEANGRAAHYFDWEHLPNLHYQNAEVARWMMEISSHWVRAFDVDGYRVDAAWGVARRNPEFWPLWSAELRRGDPDLFFLAEASARDPYWLSHGFHAAYDWSDELGDWAWKGVFGSDQGIARRLYEALVRSAKTRRPDRVLRFLNNNDTGPRFITRHGEDITRVATAALLTLPGIPCLFAFDEVGGEFDPYGPQRPLAPPHRPALREFHETLVHLRRATPALHGPGFTPLFLDSEREVVAYLRQGDGAGDVAVVVLHFASSPVSARFGLPETFSAGAVRDLITGRSFPLRRSELDIALQGWDVLILVTPREEKIPRSACERASRSSHSLASGSRDAPSR